MESSQEQLNLMALDLEYIANPSLKYTYTYDDLISVHIGLLKACPSYFSHVVLNQSFLLLVLIS